MKTYACISDGIVKNLVLCDPGKTEQLGSIYQTLVEVDLQLKFIDIGYLYDGENFQEPSEE